MFFLFIFYGKEVSAHDLDQHDSTTIAELIPDILLIALIILIGFIWFKIYIYFHKDKNITGIIRSVTVILSFILWFLVIGIQHWVLGREYSPLLYTIIYSMGIIVLPFSLFSLWRLAYSQSLEYLRDFLKKPKYLLVFLGVVVFYSLFYLFASGLFSASWLALPSADDLPVSSKSFLTFSQTYGPLTMWYTLDFWSSTLKLYGAISVGTLLMMLTVSMLMALNILLVLYSWKLKNDKIKHIPALSGATGSSVAIAATSFCCCCLPALYPVLVLLFGSAAAETLSISLINSSGPLFNVIQIGSLSFILLSILTSTKLIKSMEQDSCEL